MDGGSADTVPFHDRCNGESLFVVFMSDGLCGDISTGTPNGISRSLGSCALEIIVQIVSGYCIGVSCLMFGNEFRDNSILVFLPKKLVCTGLIFQIEHKAGEFVIRHKRAPFSYRI